ncbi:MAG: hypothetical protein M3Y60_06780 [Bacteroidota bacterium]|nr:hypothetical protein [Bacteroidota bacterium]
MMGSAAAGRLLKITAGIWLALVLTGSALFAQDVDVDVRGGFLSDSLKIGERTAYYVSAHYPSELNVLFPDSTHGFTPFEYDNKEYFLTETADGISVDSTVYYVTTFEVDRVQYLSLPVYVTHGSDCTVFHTGVDSVLITQFVAHVPDTIATAELPLRATTTYQKVFYNINVWMLVIIAAAVLILLLVGWILFGKKIRRYFATKKLLKNHTAFLDRYNAVVRQLSARFSPPATESALVTWKRYMEQLESRPYTKLTTKETQGLLGEPAITNDLSQIDRAIYGHNTQVVDSLENLKKFADQQFRRKLKEVQHG